MNFNIHACVSLYLCITYMNTLTLLTSNQNIMELIHGESRKLESLHHHAGVIIVL